MERIDLVLNAAYLVERKYGCYLVINHAKDPEIKDENTHQTLQTADFEETDQADR